MMNCSAKIRNFKRHPLLSLVGRKGLHFFRSSPILRNDLKTCYSKKNSGHGTTDQLLRALITAVLATVVAGYSGSSLSICDSPNLNNAELTALLKSRLMSIRQQLRDERRPTPLLSVLVRKGTHEIQLTAGNFLDLTSLVVNWSEVLGLHKVSAVDLVGGKLITGISVDGKSSLTVETHYFSKTITIYKDDGFTIADVDHIVEGYFLGLSKTARDRKNENEGLKNDKWAQHLDEDISSDRTVPREFLSREADLNPRQTRSPINDLQSLGVTVFDREQNSSLTWDDLAGYDSVKEQIEDTIIHSITHPDIYDEVAKSTRVVFESNQPKAVLFEGPPGTGKTLTARILARRCNRPLIHLKLESVVSKWYGDSEKKLAKIFDACEALDGCIVFIDEVDALASTRDNSNTHEATKRMLSVILQRLEGFNGRSKSLLICATNRKQDLDPALISRFDLSITYALPDFETRIAVFSRYAKQFIGSDVLKSLADATAGMSCRDIKEACQNAERRWASRKVRGLGGSNPDITAIAPDSEEYLRAISARRSTIETVQRQKTFEA